MVIRIKVIVSTYMTAYQALEHTASVLVPSLLISIVSGFSLYSGSQMIISLNQEDLILGLVLITLGISGLQASLITITYGIIAVSVGHAFSKKGNKFMISVKDIFAYSIEVILLIFILLVLVSVLMSLYLVYGSIFLVCLIIVVVLFNFIVQIKVISDAISLGLKRSKVSLTHKQKRANL